MTTPHTHRWGIVDNDCSLCGVTYWDWSQGEVRRLQAELDSKNELLRHTRDRRRKVLSDDGPPVTRYRNAGGAA